MPSSSSSMTNNEKPWEQTGPVPVVAESTDSSESAASTEADATEVLPPSYAEPTSVLKQKSAQEPETDTHDTTEVSLENEGADKVTKSINGHTHTIVCLAFLGLASLWFTQFAASGAFARHYVLAFFVILVVAASAHVVAHFFREWVTNRRTTLSEEEQGEVRDDAVMAGIVLSIVFTLVLAIVFFSQQAVWVFTWLVGNEALDQPGIIHATHAQNGTFRTIVAIVLIAILAVNAIKRLRKALLGDGGHLKAVIMFVGVLIVGILAIVLLTPVLLGLIAGVSGLVIAFAMPLAFMATGWHMLQRRLTVWSFVLAIVAGLLWVLPLGWSMAKVWGI